MKLHFTVFLLFFWISTLKAQPQLESYLPLFQAIRSNDMDSVRLLTKQNPEWAAKGDMNQATPIQWACYYGDLEMVQYFADSLHVPLLNQKGFIRVDTTLKSDRATIFHYLKGINLDTVPNGNILKSRLDVTYCGNLVSIAAIKGKIKLLRYLVETKKLPVDGREYNSNTKKWDSGLTPFQWACFSGQTIPMIYLHHAGADINANEGLALPLSVFNANPFILPYLISKGISGKAKFQGRDALQWASFTNTSVYILLLIECGYDPNVPDLEGNSPLVLSYMGQCTNVGERILLPDGSPRPGETPSTIKGKFEQMGEETRGFLRQNSAKIAIKGMEDAAKLALQMDTCTKKAWDKDNDTKKNKDAIWTGLIEQYFLSTKFLDVKERERIVEEMLKTADRSQVSQLASAYIAKFNVCFNSGNTGTMRQWRDSLKVLMPVLVGPQYGKITNNVNALCYGKMCYYLQDIEEAKSWLLQIKTLENIEPGQDGPVIRLPETIMYLTGAPYLANRLLLNIYVQENNFQKAVEITEKFKGNNGAYLAFNVLSFFAQKDGEQINKEKLEEIVNTLCSLSNKELLDSNKDFIDSFILSELVFENVLNESTFINLIKVSSNPNILTKAYEVVLNRKEVGIENQGKIMDVFRNQLPFLFSFMTIGKSLQSTFKDTKHEQTYGYYLRFISDQKVTMLFYDKKFKNLISTFSKNSTSYEEIKMSLESDEALVDYVVYSPPFSDSSFIGAFVIRNNQQYPLFVKLCLQSQIEDLLKGKSGRSDLPYRDVDPVRVLDDSANLYKLIWQPLESEITGKSKIYISPTAGLTFVNFLALKIRDTLRLMDVHSDIVILSSSRELAKSKALLQGKWRPKSIVLFGGVRYDQAPTVTNTLCKPGEKFSVTPSNLQSLGPITQPKSQNNSFQYLKGTDSEVRMIAKISLQDSLKTWLFRGSDANEEHFRRIGETYCEEELKPDIFVLSTHGYFTKREKIKVINNRGEVAEVEAENDPMNRNGLLMAGADRKKKGSMPYPGKEDGFVTANEIAQMNLKGVKLVVLSACETGLGIPDGNNGTFGLVRAFKLAGVEKVLVSLWSINDGATDKFMEIFFGLYLTQRKTPHDALKLTQLAMRNSKEFNDVSNWAPFILIE